MDGGPKMNLGCWLCALQLSIFCAVDQVLDDFRDRFIKEMDANAIIFELEQLKIITEGKMNTIRDTKEPKEKNATLHLLLKKTSTKDSMMTVCKVIIAVEGNPKMQKLGEDMMKMLSRSVFHMFTLH